MFCPRGRRRLRRRITDLPAVPRATKIAKIKTAKTIFGRRDIAPLMILMQVFQAIEKSIGISPPVKTSRGPACIHDSDLRAWLPGGRVPRRLGIADPAN